jgi:hypothetical protein
MREKITLLFVGIRDLGLGIRRRLGDAKAHRSVSAGKDFLPR